MTRDDETWLHSLEARIAKLEALVAKPAEAATASAQPGPRLRRLEDTLCDEDRDALREQADAMADALAERDRRVAPARDL